MAKNAKPADQGQSGQTGAEATQSADTGSGGNTAPNTASPVATSTAVESQAPGLPGLEDGDTQQTGNTSHDSDAIAGPGATNVGLRAPGIHPIAYGIEVVALRDGYRRAGRAWTRSPQVVPVTELSEPQLIQLRDDRELMVRLVELDTPAV